MTYRWTGAYGMIDEDLRERKQVEQFYYKLSHLLSIEELRSVEEIIVAPLCISKRRYY
jgi:regulator of sigma D